MIKCDYSGLRRLRKRLESGGLAEDCARALAERVITGAAERTPVLTGNLRRGFDCGDEGLAILRCGQVVRADITNPVEYGSFVEFGHRTKNGGWASGRFMLTLSAAEAEASAARIVSERISEFLEGCFADG